MHLFILEILEKVSWPGALGAGKELLIQSKKRRPANKENKENKVKKERTIKVAERKEIRLEKLE